MTPGMFESWREAAIGCGGWLVLAAFLWACFFGLGWLVYQLVIWSIT
jgi:hypothetical protein